MKHSNMTPGPWTIDPGASTAIIIEGEDEHIVTVEGVGPESQANAKAIAALPELVEALREISNWNPEIGPSAPDGMSIMDAIDIARSALAKIEGGEA